MKRYCGRRFTGEEIGQLCALIADNPGRTRAQLSRLACRLLQWRKADGGLKEMSCRVAMLRLHREGLLQLPPPRNRKGGSSRIEHTFWSAPQPPLSRPVHELPGVHLEPVLSRPDSALWNEYIDRDNPKLPPSVYAHDLAPEELFDAMLPPAGSDKFADFVKAEYLDVNIRDLTGGLERALSASLMDETSRVRLTEPIETFLEDSHLVIINSAGDPCVKYNRKFYSAVLSLSPDTPIAIKSMRGILSLEAKIGLARGLYVDGLLSLGETA